MRKIDFQKLKAELFKSSKKKSKKEKDVIEVNDTTEFSEVSLKENKKKKSKVNKKGILAVVIVTLLAICLVVGIAGLLYLKSAIDKAPTFSVNDFTNVESSHIYDADGELIGDVGLVSRENVSYDELPQSFIDAVVAVEDSRFFTHNGFDLPRFVKAIFKNLKTWSFSQGASTLSMQLVKNIYFVDDEKQTSRKKSIDYKIQQIYLAIKCEQELSKKSIFEYYVNRINFGASGSRGIKGAAKYYFNKEVSELNLSECAYLAGVVNLPNGYNAYKHYDNALERRNTVLYLMNYHGYISDTEYKLALSVDLADQLSGAQVSGGKYQAYINEVIDEVTDLTGKDPYSTTMNIYTYMNRKLQDQIDAIEAGENENVQWPDELMQCAIVSMDNSTGAIVGIGGGRDTIVAKGFSRVSDMYRQPGSSVKPFLSYALAFEYLGWATTHAIEDVPTVYRGTHILLNNVDNQYRGDVLMNYAVGKSLNIPAYKTLEQVLDAVGRDTIIEYLNGLGLTQVTPEKFDLGYSIGGSTFEVTVEQLAACHSAMINGGYSVVPHTVSRIEFADGSDPYIPNYPTVKVISEESAYLATSLMEQNVSTNYGNYMQILKRKKYEVYAKTGTTNYDDTFVKLGIPKGSAKDKWMVASTSEITTAVWLGYDSAVDDNCYWTSKKSKLNLPGNVNNEILKVLYEDHEPANVKRPKDVVEITHVAGLYPYTAPIEGMNADMVVTGLINKKYHSLKALTAPEIANLSSFSVSDVSISNGKVTGRLNWASYPYTDQILNEDGTYEYVLETRNDSGSPITITALVKKLYNPALIYGPIVYCADVNGKSFTCSDGSCGFSVDLPTDGSDISVVGYYQYSYGPASNRISDSIPTGIPTSEMANLTTIEAVTAFMSKYNLSWTLKPITITDPNTQSNGAIISCGNSSYPDFTSIGADKVSIAAIYSGTVEYYSDQVTVPESKSELQTFISTYGLTGWTFVNGDARSTIDDKVGAIYAVASGDDPRGASYSLSTLPATVTFKCYTERSISLPASTGTVADLKNALSGTGISISCTGVEDTAVLNTLNVSISSLLGSTVDLADIGSSVTVSKVTIKYTVTLTSNGNGSVSGGGQYEEGNTASISATADAGYHFVKWSDGDTNASRSITVNSDVSLSATFEAD